MNCGRENWEKPCRQVMKRDVKNQTINRIIKKSEKHFKSMIQTFKAETRNTF